MLFLRQLIDYYRITSFSNYQILPMTLFRTKILCAALLALGLAACSPKIYNPAAEGFDATGSDAKAIAVADQVMQAMGGRQAWDDTRYITWNFFGSRQLLWDKHAGLCRVEWLKRPWKVVVNLNNGTGKVWLNGVPQNHPDTLAKYLDFGKRAWINDSYWLVMPFKLKDAGVTLKHLGTAQTEAGEAADLLQLTFAGVGVTPDNKYHIWANKKTHLVTQWAYFQKFSDEKPQLTNAWGGYKRCGKILLSAERGNRESSLHPVEVLDSVPPGAFD
jgi:hypothetical protein